MGTREVAVIDPGPAEEGHCMAVAGALADARTVSILVTHGHPDHAPGAPGLAAALVVDGIEAEVRGPSGVEGVARPVEDGETVPTDEGELVAVTTPGHAREHVAFHWPARRALFAGDLVLGRGDTVWVGEYPGSVADYLRSLERVGALGIDVIYPAHGPPLQDPAAALARFTTHRRERIRQVEAALARRPGASAEELLEVVYGPTLPPAARRAALMSTEALIAHVRGTEDGP